MRRWVVWGSDGGGGGEVGEVEGCQFDSEGGFRSGSAPSSTAWRTKRTKELSRERESCSEEPH